MGKGIAIDLGVAGVPGLSEKLAADLRALLQCLHAHCPTLTTVLGGSLATGTAGARPDIDVFAILPSQRAALATLRSAELRAGLDALRLTADAEVVVLWESLVRSGRTSICGRMLTGDPTLAPVLTSSPAPAVPNIVATAHLFLVQSLLEPERAERLIAKAIVTGFRACLRRRDASWTAEALFSLARTRVELDALPRPLEPSPLHAGAATAAVASATPAAGASLPAAGGSTTHPLVSSKAHALIGEAVSCLEGTPPLWPLPELRARASAFLAEVGDGEGRLVRRWLRHVGTRRRAGVWPLQFLDPTRAFTRAARAVVAAADPGADRTTVTTAAAALRRVTGRCPGGEGADRVRLMARALDVYGRDYPHKLLVPAVPPVPSAGDAGPSPTVSFVIPCLNSAATLSPLLESIARQRRPPGYELETIVVDNGSSDDSATVAARHEVTVLHEPTPGASAARNTGSKQARGGVVVFVDADAQLQGEDFVHHVLRALGAAPDAGLVGAAIECDADASPLGRADHMVCFFNWQATQPAEERHFHPSAALAATRAALDATGGFDEALLSFHDFDFCRRARAQGFRLYFEPLARVAHVPRPTLASVVRHSFRWGWNSRRVYAEHDPEHTWHFLDRPLLFGLNVPFHVVNRVWLITKRWFWRRPLDTILLAPVLVVLLCSWGAGVAVGGRAWIRTAATARATH